VIAAMSTTAKPAADRPIFILELRPEPGCVDPVQALRALLKLALRRLGLGARKQ
jgi:hypothetical protein